MNKEIDVKKNVSVSIAVAGAVSGFAAQASEHEFVAHLNGFDRAQEQLRYEEIVPYLHRRVSLAISTCTGSVERYDLEKLKASYLSIQKNADALTIGRTVAGVENCGNDLGCIVHSDMSERLMAFAGKYDKTTLSRETAKLVRVDGEVKIRSIQAVIKCE